MHQHCLDIFQATKALYSINTAYFNTLHTNTCKAAFINITVKKNISVRNDALVVRGGGIFQGIIINTCSSYAYLSPY